ncbi:MAG: AAA family ATPase, partial [Prevotellaceae bacterium]|nr:AAA family ATPase [Prevotellaceae bacterium]
MELNFDFTRKLPIGIQDFEDLRTNGYLYVDKTAYIYRLLHTGKPYFLGRPRRFGKSLFLSTLKAFFLGKKEIFEGLAIAQLEKDWTKYPVLYLDFNSGSFDDGTASLRSTLANFLRNAEKEWDYSSDDDNLGVRFANLIRCASEKSNRKVVVLIDEYDKPLLNMMDNEEEQKKMRAML